MELLSPKINRWLFYLIVISLSVSPAFATDPIDNRNYFLIACMFIGPVIIIFSNRFIPKIDIPVATIIVLMFIFQYLFNRGSIRWSSMFFSCMFYVYFLAAVRVFIRSSMKIEMLLVLVRRLIFAYAIVLLIQQFCVLFGLPVFNQTWGFGEHNPWKLNSLSAEPSHTARYLGILMYSFLKIQDILKGRHLSLKRSFKINRKVWLAFLWVMITMMSGTAMIILILVLCRYIKKKNVFLFTLLLIILFPLGMSSEFVPLKRTTVFLDAVTTGDIKEMVKADHSASIRVVPFVLCLQRIRPDKFYGWVGNGTGSTSEWMSKYVPGVPYGWSGGAIANYVLEYGLILGAIFIWFSFTCCYDKKYKIPTLGLWVMCVIMIGVNTQIGWLCILMLYLSKRIKKTDENKSILQLT